MDEEREFTLTPQTALIDNDVEAIRNLSLATHLILATVGEMLETYKEVPDELRNALFIAEQSLESVNMYVERMSQ